MNIEKVLQKTYLEIDEEKTEAAATTVITMKLKGRPKKIEMNVNHPFLFFIRCNKGLEKIEQFIFMGKFEDLNK